MNSETSPILKDQQPEPDEIANAVVLSSMACLHNQPANPAVENTSPRLKDHQPDPDEIAKAVVLSSMAYLDNQDAMAAVETRYSDIGFSKIEMAQHFILAFDPNESDCNRTLYVAFRRRLSIPDMFAVNVAGRSEFIESYGKEAEDVKGRFHYGLFQIITSELPSMAHFQHYNAKKIIFSGHGLAGALAHLFLICYMINTREEDREHISIGFGSPYFCDDAAKRFCRKTMELDRRMFTFVNDTDPVPWMLKGERMTCTPESTEAVSSRQLKPVKRILKEMPRYVSVGEYCYGRGSTIINCKSVSLDIFPESVLRRIDKFMVNIQQYWANIHSLGNQPSDVDSWSGHRVESYVQEFSHDKTKGTCPSKLCMDIAHAPRIDVCTLSVYNIKTSYEGFITIKGSHLSDNCPSKPVVKPNVGHEWIVKDASESSVLFKGILSEIEAKAIQVLKADEIVEQTHLSHLSVELRTCFGSTLANLDVEDLWKDGSYVASALTRCLGKLLLMQQSEVLVGSDLYMKAFETLKRGFPVPLDRLSYSIPETKRKHFDIMKPLFTKPVEIPLQNNIIDDGHSYFSTSLSSHSQLSSMIPDYAFIPKFCHGSYFSVSDGSIRILNYRDIVRTIYYLSGSELQDEQTNVSYYEKEIYNQVKGQTVKTRQDLPEELKEDIEKRASMMYEVITASKSLECLKFAVFIGPENAGKTTLINSILGENVGGVGFTTHTTVATPYRFKEDIYLVDFPGTDGGGDRAQLSKIWEEYEQVADLCVVVLNFGGDTSRAAQTFPRIARSRMCSKIVLVINRVDSVLNGSKNSPVWAEYNAEKVEQLKISIAKDSGLPPDRVFFSVSRTSEELEESTCHLLEERHIMLKDEITSTVSRFLSELM